MHDVATDGAEKPKAVQGAHGTSKWALASGNQNRASGLSSQIRTRLETWASPAGDDVKALG